MSTPGLPSTSLRLVAAWNSWLVAALTALTGCDGPDKAAKPTKGGTGPYAYHVDNSLKPPTFHQPLDRWALRHGTEIRRGKRSRYQCVLCHDAEYHCNPCHQYARLRREIYLPARLAAATVSATPTTDKGAVP